MNAIIAPIGSLGSSLVSSLRQSLGVSLGSALRSAASNDRNVVDIASLEPLGHATTDFDVREPDVEDGELLFDAVTVDAPESIRDLGDYDADETIAIVRHSLQEALDPTASADCTEPNTTTHENAQHALMLECHAANQLIVSLLDNADEYRRAIFATEELLNSLQRRLFTRVQAAEQLQAHVRSLGMQPATTRSSLAAEFAARVETPRLLAANRQDELMQDVERGERTLQRQFSRCLKQDWLSTKGRECLTQTLEKVETSNRSAAHGSPLFGPLAKFANPPLAHHDIPGVSITASTELPLSATDGSQLNAGADPALSPVDSPSPVDRIIGNVFRQ